MHCLNARFGADIAGLLENVARNSLSDLSMFEGGSLIIRGFWPLSAMFL